MTNTNYLTLSFADSLPPMPAAHETQGEYFASLARSKFGLTAGDVAPEADSKLSFKWPYDNGRYVYSLQVTPEAGQKAQASGHRDFVSLG